MNRYYIEKRRHKRFSTVVLADLFSADLSKFLGRGCITDLSIGGMQIETKEQINVKNEEFIVKFFLPNGSAFDNIKGIIRREDKVSFTYVYGIKFTEISFKNKIRLYWYLLRH